MIVYNYLKFRTDRILWNCTDGEAAQMFYTRREYKSSDHRPVVSYFRIKAKQIDVERKQAIAKELYQQVKIECLKAKISRDFLQNKLKFMMEEHKNFQKN